MFANRGDNHSQNLIHWTRPFRNEGNFEWLEDWRWLEIVCDIWGESNTDIIIFSLYDSFAY